MRILVVEDNRDILANLADYLSLKGYTVDCAQDGITGTGASADGGGIRGCALASVTWAARRT